MQTRYINPEYIKIPNILLNDKDLTNDMRVLYAYIWYITYIDDCQATNQELCELVGITQPTLNKCISMLENKKYLKVERKNKNTRILTPLINQSMILKASSQKENYIQKIINEKREEQQQKIDKAIAENVPECYKDFLQQVR